jgi:isopenicillin N synthase-like dioxygenase
MMATRVKNNNDDDDDSIMKDVDDAGDRKTTPTASVSPSQDQHAVIAQRFSHTKDEIFTAMETDRELRESIRFFLSVRSEPERDLMKKLQQQLEHVFGRPQDQTIQMSNGLNLTRNFPFYRDERFRLYGDSSMSSSSSSSSSSTSFSSSIVTFHPSQQQHVLSLPSTAGGIASSSTLKKRKANASTALPTDKRRKPNDGENVFNFQTLFEYQNETSENAIKDLICMAKPLENLGDFFRELCQETRSLFTIVSYAMQKLNLVILNAGEATATAKRITIKQSVDSETMLKLYQQRGFPPPADALRDYLTAHASEKNEYYRIKASVCMFFSALFSSSTPLPKNDTIDYHALMFCAKAFYVFYKALVGEWKIALQYLVRLASYIPVIANRPIEDIWTSEYLKNIVNCDPDFTILKLDEMMTPSIYDVNYIIRMRDVRVCRTNMLQLEQQQKQAGMTRTTEESPTTRSLRVGVESGAGARETGPMIRLVSIENWLTQSLNELLVQDVVLQSTAFCRSRTIDDDGSGSRATNSTQDSKTSNQTKADESRRNQWVIPHIPNNQFRATKNRIPGLVKHCLVILQQLLDASSSSSSFSSSSSRSSSSSHTSSIHLPMMQIIDDLDIDSNVVDMQSARGLHLYFGQDHPCNSFSLLMPDKLIATRQESKDKRFHDIRQTLVSTHYPLTEMKSMDHVEPLSFEELFDRIETVNKPITTTTTTTSTGASPLSNKMKTPTPVDRAHLVLDLMTRCLPFLTKDTRGSGDFVLFQLSVRPQQPALSSLSSLSRTNANVLVHPMTSALTKPSSSTTTSSSSLSSSSAMSINSIPRRMKLFDDDDGDLDMLLQEMSQYDSKRKK